MKLTDNEKEELARNIALSRALLAFVGAAGCGPEPAVCALLTAATALIETNHPAAGRLAALNEYLAPTIHQWAAEQAGAPVGVTIQ